MKRLLFTFVAIVIVLGLLEVTSRLILNQVYNRKFDSSLIVDNKYFTSSGLKENATGYVWGKLFHTDEFGCRKSPVTYAPKKKKWLFIGDSVTEGVGVEDSSTFAALVAKHVDSMNIMNYSLIGYGDGDYLNVLKTLLAAPDTTVNRVTIFFCLNDVYGMPKSTLPPVISRQNILGRINGLLQDRYATYKLIKLLVYQNTDRYFRFDAHLYSADGLFFKRSMIYLMQCSDVCNIRGVKMDVVMLPYRSQLNNPDNGVHNPQNMVKEFCLKNGISFYDPIGFCSKDNNPQKLYLLADEIHFSEEGHKTIARYILSH